MAITYINTNQVDSISKDIINLTNDLNKEFNDLFRRFSDVPTVTREWVGKQANIYFSKIASEKQQYIDFTNKIKDIGYKLSTDIYEIQTCINKNNNEESKKGN